MKTAHYQVLVIVLVIVLGLGVREYMTLCSVMAILGNHTDKRIRELYDEMIELKSRTNYCLDENAQLEFRVRLLLDDKEHLLAGLEKYEDLQDGLAQKKCSCPSQFFINLWK
jgi:hypothetical protein